MSTPIQPHTLDPRRSPFPTARISHIGPEVVTLEEEEPESSWSMDGSWPDSYRLISAFDEPLRPYMAGVVRRQRRAGTDMLALFYYLGIWEVGYPHRRRYGSAPEPSLSHLCVDSFEIGFNPRAGRLWVGDESIEVLLKHPMDDEIHGYTLRLPDGWHTEPEPLNYRTMRPDHPLRNLHQLPEHFR